MRKFQILLSILFLFLILANLSGQTGINNRDDALNSQRQLMFNNSEQSKNNRPFDSTFTKIIIDSTLDVCWGIATEDLDNDTDLDIIISQALIGEINWYENTGNFNFIKHQLFSSTPSIFQIEVIDFDNDGDLDIIFGKYVSGLYVLINDGLMNFGEHFISPNISWMFKVVDVNQDGLIDIVGNNNTSSLGVYYVEQDSSHSFTSFLIDSLCGDAYGIDAVDLDSDGDVDIVQGSTNTYHNLYWYENDGSEFFTKHLIDDNISGPLDLVCNDIDEDNDIDIIVPAVNANELRIYKNNGQQQFSHYTIADSIVGMWFIDIADIDKNSTLDIVISSRNSSYLIWLSNNGDSTFTEFNIDESIQYPQNFILKDLNNDENLDIFLISGRSAFGQFSHGQLTLYINNKTPSSIKEQKDRLTPNKHLLFQNFPNPFNPLTKIKYTLPKSENVKIEIFNLLGQKISTLLNKKMPSGSHEIEFTAKDLPSGVYLYRIEAGDFQVVKKMILLR